MSQSISQRASFLGLPNARIKSRIIHVPQEKYDFTSRSNVDLKDKWRNLNK